MVTKPNMPVPPAPTGLKKLPDVEPATVVAGASNTKAAAPDAANRDRSGDNTFKLPEKVSQAEIRDNSFKYGGGRSAGNRPLTDAVHKNIEE